MFGIYKSFKILFYAMSFLLKKTYDLHKDFLKAHAVKLSYFMETSKNYKFAFMYELQIRNASIILYLIGWGITILVSSLWKYINLTAHIASVIGIFESHLIIATTV